MTVFVFIGNEFSIFQKMKAPRQLWQSSNPAAIKVGRTFFNVCLTLSENFVGVYGTEKLFLEDSELMKVFTDSMVDKWIDGWE